MAFGRLERTVGEPPMSEINVTPLVDVMLVLVVIFIITAPLLASSIRLDLPKAEGTQSGEAEQDIDDRAMFDPHEQQASAGEQDDHEANDALEGAFDIQ